MFAPSKGHRKIPNISPGLIELHKTFWCSCIRKVFWVNMRLVYAKNSQFSVQSERLIIAFNT